MYFIKANKKAELKQLKYTNKKKKKPKQYTLLLTILPREDKHDQWPQGSVKYQKLHKLLQQNLQKHGPKA